MSQPDDTALQAGDDTALQNSLAQLVRDLQKRPRLLDRDIACEPDTVRRVLADLDAHGPSEVGDVIHSLLWLANLNGERAKRFAGELLGQVKG